MQPVRLFNYSTYATAVIVEGYEGTNNMPISNSKIKVHKGRNQTLQFGVYNSDGKPYELPADVILVLRVLNTHTNTEVIRKELTKSTIPTQIPGRVRQSVSRNDTIYSTTILNGESVDLADGAHYNWAVNTENSTLTGEYLYSGLKYDVAGELEIISEAFIQLTPAVDTKSSIEWQYITPNNTGWDLMDHTIVGTYEHAIRDHWKLYRSSAYPADAQYNFLDGVHSACIYTDDNVKFEEKIVGLTGTFTVQATLSDSVPDQGSNVWFNIPDENGLIYREYHNNFKLDNFNFYGGYRWIRFNWYAIEPDIWVVPGNPIPPTTKTHPGGMIQKVLYRV